MPHRTSMFRTYAVDYMSMHYMQIYFIFTDSQSLCILLQIICYRREPVLYILSVENIILYNFYSVVLQTYLLYAMINQTTDVGHHCNIFTSDISTKNQ